MSPIQAKIESYLLARACWVKAAELEDAFGIRERQLRQLGRKPGLCTEFAISSSEKGLKHISLATTGEWLHARNAERRAAIARLRRVKLWTLRRSNVTKSIHRPEIMFERDTGQVLMEILNSETG